MMPSNIDSTGVERMVEQAVRRIVEAIAAQAPDGWTDAVLHAQAGRRGTEVTGGYGLQGAEGSKGAKGMKGATSIPGVPNPYKELMALAEGLREARGWEPVSLEIRCLPSGEYRLVAFTDAITRVTGMGNGFQVVLDPGYRLPQPGEQQDAGAAAPAGDPELAVARLRAYLERRAAILGHPMELAPPATVAAIEEAERRLGHRLPADLRALYLIADGEGLGHENSYLFHGHAWLSLESMVDQHTQWGASERPWFGWDLEWDAVVFETDPADTVRRSGGHPGWLRFGSSEDGNYLAVDMAPARDGRPGQIIKTGRDYDDGPVHVADSVTSLLGHCLDLLDQGAYEEDADYISLIPPGPGRVGPTQFIGSAIPDEVPPTLQAIHINDVTGLVDLTPLTAAPNLHRLHLNRSTTADLTPVRELPVESMRITLAGGNLTPLEAHPHLTSLGLTTTNTPADISVLRTIPHLRGLDLSGADVPNLPVLADFPDLRYLALTARQWATLLKENKVPPTLAAARLAGTDTSLDDALAWAARLGLNTENAVRVTGTLTASDG